MNPTWSHGPVFPSMEGRVRVQRDPRFFSEAVHLQTWTSPGHPLSQKEESLFSWGDLEGDSQPRGHEGLGLSCLICLQISPPCTCLALLKEISTPPILSSWVRPQEQWLTQWKLENGFMSCKFHDVGAFRSENTMNLGEWLDVFYLSVSTILIISYPWALLLFKFCLS